MNVRYPNGRNLFFFLSPNLILLTLSSLISLWLCQSSFTFAQYTVWLTTHREQCNCLHSLGIKCTFHPTFSINEPVPQVLKPVVNLSFLAINHLPAFYCRFFSLNIYLGLCSISPFLSAHSSCLNMLYLLPSSHNKPYFLFICFIVYFSSQ